MSKEAEEYFNDKHIARHCGLISGREVYLVSEMMKLMESYHQHRLENDIPSDKDIEEISFKWSQGMNLIVQRRHGFEKGMCFLKQHLLKTNK